MRSGSKFAPIFLLLVMSAQGCAGSPENADADVSAEIRESLGSVGIVTVGPEPEPEALGIIGSVGETVIGGGRGMLIGGAGGLAVGILAGTIAGGGIGGAVVALGAFAAGLVGGTAAGVLIAGGNSVPAGTERALETALMGALSTHDLRAETKEKILSVASVEGNLNLSDLGSIDEAAVLSAGDYQRLAETGATTVLEIGIAQIALFQAGDSEVQATDFALLINAYANLTTIADQERVWSNEQIIYVSMPSALSEWTAPGVDHLTSEIDIGVDTLAREISAEVFGTMR